MSDFFDKIDWPAIIHYDNDAELDYVENASHWKQKPEWYQGNFEETDFLIDSHGRVFTLQADSTQHVVPLFSGNSLSLTDILGLAKAHLSELGSCCVAKLYAPSIEEAFKMIKSGNECPVDEK